MAGRKLKEVYDMHVGCADFEMLKRDLHGDNRDEFDVLRLALRTQI